MLRGKGVRKIDAARSVSVDGPLFSIGGRETFLLSGEFHYFRVPRAAWGDRLRRMRDIGLTATSIYVPWNWHQPDPDAPADLDGRTSPERDLRGALDEIDAAGLDCIFRPGPFITAEWQGGGIPDWLWEREPNVLALDATGAVSAPQHPYPGLTHRHPVYRVAERAWLEAACGVAAEHLASRGGCVIDLQLDDEPSYWQRISMGSLAADYNPLLVRSNGGNEPSRFGAWALERHGSLDAVNATWGTSWKRASEVAPPRAPMAAPGDLPLHADWFDFKLFEVNEDMQFQYETALGCGIDVPVSMLFPYLLALNAARFTDFIEERGLPLHLTNECYLSLFGPQSCDERKIGDIVATHETYHLWRRDHGPAISMELQGSNSTNITPGAMELLYAVTIARGIKGINIFMMVGGENPAGYENVTGRGYDISAPIDVDGNERPHAGVLRKLARVIDAGGRALLEAEPLRDTWIGCLAPYERDALVGGEGPMARVAELLSTTFSGGDMGLSNAASLPSLMTLAGVSFGCVDLERATVEELLALPQLWVPGLPHLERGVQERLVAFVQGGGHLLILPEVPTADERGGECRVLWDACMEGVIVTPPDARASTEAMHMLTTPAGESLVAPGRCWRFELPSGTEALAHDVKTGSPVAFTRPSGDGRVAVLGFHLEYVPNEQTDQMDFVERLATDAGARSLAARASTRRVAAMQLSSDRGAFVCLVNPVELPVATRVRCTTPRGTPLELPVAIDGIAFAGVGARLLPVGLQLEGGAVIHHATWELVAARDDRLTFSTPGEEPGEVHIAGLQGWGVTGAEVLERRSHDDGTLLVLRPQGVTCTLAPEGGGGA